MRVLVIGGAGFIGFHTVDYLLERGHWEPTKTFRQGVSDLIEWVQSQQDVQDGAADALDELRQRDLVA